MNKSYLKQMLTYINVELSTIIFVVLFGFMLEMESFNRLDHWLEKEKFKKILPKKTKTPRIDAIRDCLSNFDLVGVSEVLGRKACFR